ncbi:MAG: phage holin family protein [Verrucomicrobiota bacterium]
MSAPANWSDALLTLVAARLALIELELKQATAAGARRASSLIAGLACLGLAWALLLAGGIALIAQASGWPWAWVAVAGAALHLLAALGFARAARTPAAPAFPVTRAEFHKDREWIETLQQTPKPKV